MQPLSVASPARVVGAVSNEYRKMWVAGADVYPTTLAMVEMPFLNNQLLNPIRMPA
jgi:hypothetical protein